MRKNKFLELQNGSDIRGVALPGVEGEEVNRSFFCQLADLQAEYQSPEP